VVVADIDPDNARVVAASVNGSAFKCDVGKEKDIFHVIDETERQFGPMRCSAPMPVSAAGSTRCLKMPAAPRMSRGHEAGRFMSWLTSMRRGIWCRA
jgi:hypothetical protein